MVEISVVVNFFTLVPFTYFALKRYFTNLGKLLNRSLFVIFMAKIHGLFLHNLCSIEKSNSIPYDKKDYFFVSLLTFFGRIGICTG